MGFETRVTEVVDWVRAGDVNGKFMEEKRGFNTCLCLGPQVGIVTDPETSRWAG